MQGGSAPSMLDDEWAHGGDDESLMRSIRDGIPGNGMPPWGALFSDKDIRALVNYIHEVRAKHRFDQTVFAEPADDMVLKSGATDFRLKTWMRDVVEPWSMVFLPDGRAIVNEKRGRSYLVSTAEPDTDTRIEGLPPIFADGQGGLYDVVPHPDYANNGWLYFAFADGTEQASITRVIRGRLEGHRLIDVSDIFRARPEHYVSRRSHYGGRIVFDEDGYLFFTLGERGRRDDAQDLSLPNGKIHRLHDDGRIPADNPFVATPDALPSIWSYGHRNPQGLALHPITGELFSVEHGPRGGDELNLVLRGANYGWPLVTFGIEYNGNPISDRSEAEGMQSPLTHWTPSIGICGLDVYDGDLFPEWKHQLFIASLSGESVERLRVVEGRVVERAIVLQRLGRVRHVVTGPDGALYVLLPRRIARLSPVE
jgi:glucose/arabinose dehydrogenase